MKKIILFTTIVLFIFTNLDAQNKFIKKDEYDSALIKAAQKQNNLPRRESGIINFYDAKKVIYEKRTSIYEYISADKTRSISKTEENGVVTEKYEFVKLGDVEYSKKDDESWKKKERLKGGSFGGDFVIGDKIENKEVEEFLVLPTTLDNQITNMYFNYRVSKAEKDNQLIFVESRNWISMDGLTLKWTYKVSNTVPENVSHISTTNYEYNPKDLKIEAPIK